jgi:hypothetical protein
MGLVFKPKLTRYNLEGKVVEFNSREYGYLILELEYFDVEIKTVNPEEVTGELIEEEIRLKTAVPPLKVRFVPDPKLSVNQIMEFKKFHTDMRMTLSRSQGDGGLSIIYRNGQIYFKLCHYTSEIEIGVDQKHLSQIGRILDQICIVISTNTFFKLDLKEIKKSGRKTYQEVTNYLWSYFR